MQHPGVREVDLVFLAWIPLQVVHERHIVRSPGRVEVVLCEQVHLPLMPLSRLQPVALEAQHDVASRLFGVTQQEIGHVHAVDLPVGWHRAAARLHERREEVDLVDELVADLARGNVSGPPDDARRPVRALERGEQPAPPRSRRPVPLTARRVWVNGREAVGGVGTVVRRPHDDRVVGDAELVELVEDHPGEVVHLGEDVSPVPSLGLPRVLGVWNRWDVHLRVRQVEIEGLARVLGAGHEVAGPFGDLAVEARPELGVVGGEHLGLGALLARVDRARLEGDLFSPA